MRLVYVSTIGLLYVGTSFVASGRRDRPPPPPPDASLFPRLNDYDDYYGTYSDALGGLSKTSASLVSATGPLLRASVRRDLHSERYSIAAANLTGQLELPH